MNCSSTTPVNPCYGNTKCTLYTGANLSCSGILNNDTLTTVITKLDAKICTATFTLTTANTNTISLSGAGTLSSPLSANLVISPQVGNTIQALSDGVYTAGVAYSFTNGLTETGGVVKLGGTLTQNTTISISTFQFTVAGVNFLLTSYLNASGTKLLTTDTTGKVQLVEASTYLTNAGYPTLQQVLTNGNVATLGATISDLTVTGKFSALTTGLFSALLLNSDPTKFLQTDGFGKFILSSLTAVSDFTAGNLSPIFTTTVTNPTTAPALTFNLTSVLANRFLGGPTSGTGAPTYRALVQGDIPQDMTGYIWNQTAAVQTPGTFNISGNGTATQLTILTGGSATSPGTGGICIGEISTGIFQASGRTKLGFQVNGNLGMYLNTSRQLKVGQNAGNTARGVLNGYYSNLAGNASNSNGLVIERESDAVGDQIQLRDNGALLSSFNYLGYAGIGTAASVNALLLLSGTIDGTTVQQKFNSGTNITTPVPGGVEYDGTFKVTNSDSTRRHVVTAPNTTKVTAGAPLANDGYILVNIGGTNFKLMTTA